jgi:hypothetical protein
MRVGFVSLTWVLAVVAVMVVVLVFCLVGTSSAEGQWTAVVIPKVNVESGGSLSILSGTVNENQIDFGEMGPGVPQEKTLTLGVTANDSWRLTVSKSQDFQCSTPSDPGYLQSIPSSNFTYTSNGSDGATYISTPSEFGATASPSDVVTNGSAVSNSNINVVYRLVIPADQLTGYYTAPSHTYTLTVGSP